MRTIYEVSFKGNAKIIYDMMRLCMQKICYGILILFINCIDQKIAVVNIRVPT